MTSLAGGAAIVRLEVDALVGEGAAFGLVVAGEGDIVVGDGFELADLGGGYDLAELFEDFGGVDLAELELSLFGFERGLRLFSAWGGY